MGFRNLRLTAEIDDDTRYVWELEPVASAGPWEAWIERDMAWAGDANERRPDLDRPSLREVLELLSKLDGSS